MKRRNFLRLLLASPAAPLVVPKIPMSKMCTTEVFVAGYPPPIIYPATAAEYGLVVTITDKFEYYLELTSHG